VRPRSNNATVARVDARTFIAAPPEKVWALVSDFAGYPHWDHGSLLFVPAPKKVGAPFLLLTKVGPLPPAPIPCKVSAAWPLYGAGCTATRRLLRIHF
jgi:hypothetical protein